MSRRLVPNIDKAGRLVRFVLAALLLAVAVIGSHYRWWLCAIFVVAGAFVLFEALQGWCALRACGIRTKL